nr:TetR/AcrR family transcriptional regulator [Corynebacterium lactis]
MTKSPAPGNADPACTSAGVTEASATERFLNLSADKKQRIESAAMAEFASRGYEKANTNRIAAAAGISVGALFQYFPTKARLFEYVTARGAELIEVNVAPKLDAPGGVFDSIEEILHLIVSTSREHPEAVALYHLLTSPGNDAVPRNVAFELERFTSSAYVGLISAAQEAGDVRRDISAETIAWLIDDIFMHFQYSLTSEYFRQRRQLYLRDLPVEEVISETSEFIRSAIAPR